MRWFWGWYAGLFGFWCAINVHELFVVVPAFVLVPIVRKVLP